MARDYYGVLQRNIARYREMLEQARDPRVRAVLQALLHVEDAKLDRAQAGRAETQGKIKRYRDKADELRAVADQADVDRAQTRLRIAAGNYDNLANMLEKSLSETENPAERAGG